MRSSYRYWLLALTLVLATPVAAQRDRDRSRDGDDDQRSRIDTTVAFEKGGTVDLSLLSGEIIVTTADKDEVRVRAESERGTLRLEASPARLSLDVRPEHGGMGDTRYELTVPKSARILARSNSGDISVRGGAEVEAHSVSGDVAVSDISGRATVESVSGGVDATRVGGGLRISTVSGDLRVEGLAGDLDAQTVSGELQLHGVKSSYVQTETVSGDITFEGTSDPKGRYDFHSHSGEIRLTLPTGTAGSFSVETFSGEVESECPMTLQPSDDRTKHSHRRLEFSIGGGNGARYTLETFSGDVTIHACGASRQED